MEGEELTHMGGGQAKGGCVGVGAHDQGGECRWRRKPSCGTTNLRAGAVVGFDGGRLDEGELGSSDGGVRR